MARVLLVDDSASARALLGVRLRERAYDVIEVASAAEAAEIANESAPDAVVTDLWMPGISGLQLCRLLRADPATATVPIVLLTASDDRRSRFWARNAGATAYVTKTEIDRLIDVLEDVTSGPKTRPPPTLLAPPISKIGGDVRERLSVLLDASLFESTIAGEIRALAQKAEELEQLFEALVALASEVAGYRWLALSTDAAAPPQVKYTTRLFLHAHPDQRDGAEREARDALAVPHPPERRKPDEGDAFVIADKRAVDAEWSTPPILLPVKFGDQYMGQVALAPSRRGASHDDRKLVALLSNELGGPLRMASLVAEARRLASTDTLTGLLNRRAFVERIDKARAVDPKALYPMSMLLLDVDFFKKVNDTLGHDAGDAVLQGSRASSPRSRARATSSPAGAARSSSSRSPRPPRPARASPPSASAARSPTRYLLPSGAEHRCTASIGLASAEGPDWQVDELLGRADKAMYSAKHRGRNRVETA